MNWKSACLLLALGTQAGAQQPLPASVLDAAAKRIEKAAPEKATVAPERARKLLVYNYCKGFYHGSIPYGAKAMEILGKKTGAFQTVVTDKMDLFEPGSLQQFDAVCLNNTTGEIFLPKDIDKLPQAEQDAARKREALLKQSLLDFVRNGKGIVGVHAATDCYYNWSEYGEMIGGYFNHHPWHEKVGIKVDDPGHPLCAAFDPKGFTIVDEIYQFKDPYSRDALRVLLSLDVNRTDMTKESIRREDKDFAVSWTRRYGLGRVFYCSLGHRNEIFWNPAVLQYYLDGIQFALGDLPAPITPSNKLDEWEECFNGKDFSGWICKKGAWTVKNGALARGKGGYVWTKKQYENFVFECEFKISKKGNSGIFFRTAALFDPVQTGIEMQVLDSHGKPHPSKHDCGAIYDCLAPSKNAVRPAGEWNLVRILCKDNEIGVTLNGENVLQMDLNQWTQPGKNPDGTDNKFKKAYQDMPRKGHIGFQDHGDDVWYRNIRIKPL